MSRVRRCVSRMFGVALVCGVRGSSVRVRCGLWGAIAALRACARSFLCLSCVCLCLWCDCVSKSSGGVGRPCGWGAARRSGGDLQVRGAHGTRARSWRAARSSGARTQGGEARNRSAKDQLQVIGKQRAVIKVIKAVITGL